MEAINLNIIQRFRLQLSGYTYVGHRSKPGWKDSIPHYAFKCPKHGTVVDYPHGYNQRLECPQCREEKKQRGVIN